MPSSNRRAHKHFRLDAEKIQRVKAVLRADTETEAMERALDFVLSEHERNARVARAHQRFAASRPVIRDAYGSLEP